MPFGDLLYYWQAAGDFSQYQKGAGLVLLYAPFRAFDVSALHAAVALNTVSPQPLGHLADRGAAQHARAARVAEGRFDVPRAQAARVHLDGELLELRRPAGQAGAGAGHERLGARGDLRHPVLDRAFGGPQPGAAIAVPIAAPRLGAVFVVAHRQLQQLGPRVAVGHAVGQQLSELLACPFRGRYSRLHGDASSCRRRQPASLGFVSKQECIPVSLSSKLRTSPLLLAALSVLICTERISRREAFLAASVPWLLALLFVASHTVLEIQPDISSNL